MTKLILQNVPDHDIEHSETLLYYVHLLEEIGDLSEALSVLDSNAKTRAIVDRTAIMEIRGIHHLRSHLLACPYCLKPACLPNSSLKKPNVPGDLC